MSALQKKLWRDLWRLRWQCLTIAVLVGCGIASAVAALSASASLSASCESFYAEARFADVFAPVRRAPRAMLGRLAALPGVVAADGRVSGEYRVEVADATDPITARFVSIGWPRDAQPNATIVREGRMPEPGSADEVLLGEGFAEAWHLRPGDAISAVIEGRRARLRVVGIAVSPDFVYAANPRTGLPDLRHYGVIWMDEDALARAAGYVGATNEIALRLARGADVAETIRRVDALLLPYGGLGAYGRDDQPSAKMLEQKIRGVRGLAGTLPIVFLGVAAFLLYVVLSRVVGTQRDQIATLKALGYHTRELLFHYLELAGIVCALGVLVGVALGVLGARGLLSVYAQYFKFPSYVFRLEPVAIFGASAFALLAALLGAYLAVRRTVAIPPAEAMRPEAPPAYHASILDRLYAWLAPMTRMVLRDAARRPFRLVVSAGSIALATSIVLAGGVFRDSIDTILHLQFESSRREQITVTLDTARPIRAVRDLEHVPGVIRAESERVVPIRLRAAQRVRTTVLLGLEPGMDMHRLLDRETRPLRLPTGGLSLSRVLAASLQVREGDPIDVEVLDGDRRSLRLPVGALVDDLFGIFAYMDARELAARLDEERRANLVLVAASARDLDAVVARLEQLPAVAAVSRPELDQSLFRAEIADALGVESIMLAFFAAAIAVGVVYNNARIALELRARDLATMRILGFSRAELAVVLLGEQAIQVLLGVGPGLLLGRSIGQLWASAVDQERSACGSRSRRRRTWPRRAWCSSPPSRARWSCAPAPIGSTSSRCSRRATDASGETS